MPSTSVCATCGGPQNRPRYNQCRSCADQARKERAAQGLHHCIDCGSKVTKRSTARCQPCSARFRARNVVRAEPKRCVTCDVPLASRRSYINHCRPCAAKLRRGGPVAPRLCVDCGAELKAHNKTAIRCKACRIRIMPRQNTTDPKACTKCGEVKPAAEYYWNKAGNRRYSFCRACHYADTSARARANRDVRNAQQRHYNRAIRLGISMKRYRELGIDVLLATVTACQACGSDGYDKSRGGLCLDHDHATGEVRGILCAHCNRALGLLADDPVRIRQLADYVASATATRVAS